MSRNETERAPVNLRSLLSLAFLVSGMAAIWLFHARLYVPVIVSVATFVLATLHMIHLYRVSRVGLLTILLFVAYALPFIHTVPYIWFDFGADTPTTLWGLAVNAYMTDKVTVELMSMIGATGAVAFVAGTSLGRGRVLAGYVYGMRPSRPLRDATLPLSVFLVWVAGAIVLTWMFAPTETLFVREYTESASAWQNLNFASAWMISYALLIFVLADSIFDSSPSRGRLKRRIILYSILLIVIWFQLLRGDRESLPFVLAALLMYFAWGRGLPGAVASRAGAMSPVVLMTILLVFVGAYLVGAVRSSLAGIDSISAFRDVLADLWVVGAFRIDNLITGTWSAALLTPLSVAGDYVSDSLPLKLGRTYLDLLGSIIPGFVADWLNYSRPIDDMRGPAWEMTYGIGGTHAVVVPFLDFRMAGVFFILALWGYVFARVERYATRRRTVTNLALLGMMAMAVPHWMWYGEKYIINALIIWVTLSFVYRIHWVRSSDLRGQAGSVPKPST